MKISRNITCSLAAVAALLGAVLPGTPAIAQESPGVSVTQSSSSVPIAGLQCFDQINHNVLTSYVATYYGGVYNAVCDQCNARAVEGVEGGAWGTFGCWVTSRNPGYVIELWVKP
ncbi:hypothetical protein [Amycolatopsis sp. NPDC004378]